MVGVDSCIITGCPADVEVVVGGEVGEGGGGEGGEEGAG